MKNGTPSGGALAYTRPVRAALLTGLLLAGVPTSAVTAQEPRNLDQSGLTDLHPGAFAPRADLRFVSGAEARLPGDDLVLGVEVGSEARAYPLNLMWKPTNEVLNDVVGGTAVAVTWCPIAHSGVVYERKVRGQVQRDIHRVHP